MVRRLANTAFKRVAAAAIWTAALVTAVYLADSALLGPEEPHGWIEAVDLDEAKQVAGVSIDPRYLPEGLSWPPTRVLARAAPQIGLWYGVSETSGDGLVLWFGFGFEDLPDSVASVVGCAAAASPCPEPWQTATVQLSGQMVHVVSRLGAEVTERVVGGIQFE